MFGNRRRWMAALYLIVAGGVCLTGTCGRCLGQAAAGDYEDASGGSPEAVARAPVLPVDIERIVWWLPEDTESLLVSRGKVPIRRAGPPAASGGPTIPFIIDAVESAPFQDLVARDCMPLFSGPCPLFTNAMRNQFIKQVYGGARAVWFVKAARWDEAGLPETCNIVVFRDNTGRWLRDRLIATVPTFRQEIEGVLVAKIDLCNGMAITPEYRWFAAFWPSGFVCTNSEGLMKTLIHRFKQRGRKRALGPELPEWRWVDTRAPAWGIRHYCKQTMAFDRYSMLQYDPQAVGLVMFCGDKPAPFVALRYLSNSPDGGERFMRKEAEWDRLPLVPREFLERMRQMQAGVFEDRVRVNASREEALRDQRCLTSEQTKLSLAVRYLPLLGF